MLAGRPLFRDEMGHSTRQTAARVEVGLSRPTDSNYCMARPQIDPAGTDTNRF